MIRVAATGDVHFGTDSAGLLLPHLQRLTEQADLLLVAGDITRHGDPAEALAFAQELADLQLPKVAVLGNHDYHGDQHEQVRAALESCGIVVLEGQTASFDIDGTSVAVVGSKGFGGGFAGACGTCFGEPEMKAFISHTHQVADTLRAELLAAHADITIALLHYAPVDDTLEGERLEIYPFLGSYLLGEAIDEGGADVIFHGHAHGGSEKGVTPGGIHVRNVAQPLLGQAYKIYSVSPNETAAHETAWAHAATGIA